MDHQGKKPRCSPSQGGRDIDIIIPLFNVNMEGRKNFSIGITINLENYENLRLEVSGDVGDVRDTESYIAFLDQILTRLGRADEATAARIDSYRRRVFLLPGFTPEGAEQPVQPVQGEILPSPPPIEPVAPPAAAVSPGVGPAPDAAEEKPRAPPAPSKDVPKPGEFVCEECRAPITKGQHQMSQLFMGKTLCKRCMHAPAQGG